MEKLIVLHPHAYRHGVGDEEIEYAWNEYFIEHEREEDENGEIEIVRIGPKNEYVDISYVEISKDYTDCLGIIGVAKPYGYLIEHAKRPPIDSLLEEIATAQRSK
ncbi:MAG: hypothetical protein IKZ87_08120 [Actinomycetaceae bacterium]|nr:hypothetical protein [Actinomycetaceae bacterium]